MPLFGSIDIKRMLVLSLRTLRIGSLAALWPTNMFCTFYESSHSVLEAKEKALLKLSNSC